MDERMGHDEGSVFQSRYFHVTAGMGRQLMDGLTRMWNDALDQRRPISPGSPVATLDALLRGSL